MAHILIRTQDGKSTLVELVKPTNIIGRTNEANIIVQDPLVSRKHACISKLIEDEYKITDLDSQNGTFINKVKIKEHILKDEDEITVGNSIIVFIQSSSTLSKFSKSISTKAFAGLHQEDYVKRISEMSPDVIMDAKESISQKISEFKERGEILEKGDETDRFYLLYQLGRVINSERSVEEVYSTTISMLTNILNIEKGIIILTEYSGKGVNLKPVYAYDKERGKISVDDFHFSSTIAKRVVDEKMAIITSDAKHDPRFSEGLSVVQFNIRAAISSPIWDKDEILGVIYLDNPGSISTFKEDDVDILSAVANLLALRIKQEKLNEQLRREAIVRSNLERYFSPDVAEHIMKRLEHTSDLKIEIKETEATLLFIDIDDFTKMAERMKPADVAELLNLYCQIITNVVFKCKGSVNKFLGDGIFALFGAPVEIKNHQMAAVSAAIEILKEIRQHQEKNSFKHKFTIRIGINSGQIVVGDIGPSNRLEYTALGDAVNIASRLEEIARPDTIIIGEATYQAVKDHFKTKLIYQTKLRGREQVSSIYEVIV